MVICLLRNNTQIKFPLFAFSRICHNPRKLRCGTGRTQTMPVMRRCSNVISEIFRTHALWWTTIPHDIIKYNQFLNGMFYWQRLPVITEAILHLMLGYPSWSMYHYDWWITGCFKMWLADYRVHWLT